MGQLQVLKRKRKQKSTGLFIIFLFCLNFDILFFTFLFACFTKGALATPSIIVREERKYDKSATTPALNIIVARETEEKEKYMEWNMVHEYE